MKEEVMMNDRIIQQINDVFPVPQLMTTLVMNPVIDNEYLKSVIKTRQSIRLSLDEFRSLIKEKDIMFYNSDIREIEDPNGIILDDKINLSDIRDGYSVSEYVGGYEKYLVHPYYIRYVEEHNEEVIVTIYGGEDLFDLDRRPSIIRERVDLHSVLSIDKQIVLPQFDFPIPKSLHYTTFGTKKYESGLLIPGLQDPIHLMCIDIPYSYYKYQPLHPSIYNFDMDNQNHIFGDMPSDAFLHLYDDIIFHGIREPLFLRMNGEVLSSPDIETNMILFIAKMFKIPYIPAVVYLSDEDIMKNRIIDAMVTNDKQLQDIICQSTEYMVNMFEPYFVLYREDDPNSAMVRTADSEYNVAFYPTFGYTDHLKVRYFDKSIDPNIIVDQNKKTEEEHEKLRQEAVTKLDDDVQKMIDSLLGNN